MRIWISIGVWARLKSIIDAIDNRKEDNENFVDFR